MNRNGLVAIGTTLVVATIAAWFFMAPDASSGWLIFAAYVAAAAVSGYNRHSLIAVVAGAGTVSGSAAAVWYLGNINGYSDSGYLLGLAVIVTLVALYRIGKVSRNSSNN